MSSTISQPHHPESLLEEGVKSCKDVLSTLPKQRGWSCSDHIYQYQNFWYPAEFVQGILSIQRNFRALDSDIIITTYPKCGTTWLKALSFSIVNRFHFNKAKEEHPLLKHNPHSLVPLLDSLYSSDENPDLTCSLSRNTNNRLLATHFPFASLRESIKDSKCKLVYLCRDPKDTLISYWHFLNKISPRNSESLSSSFFEECCEKYCEGAVDFGSFWDHVLGYWKVSLECPERVCFFKYEEMIREPKFHLMKLAQFLGYPISAEEENGGVVEDILDLCSFDNLSNLEINRNGKMPGLGVDSIEFNAFFRRGKVGDHENYLTPAMIQRLDQITQDKLHKHGLKF